MPYTYLDYEVEQRYCTILVPTVDNIAELEKRVSMEFGKPMRVKYLDGNKQEVNTKVQENPIETFAQDFDLPFNVIE